MLLLFTALVIFRSFSFAFGNQTRFSVSVMAPWPVKVLVNGVTYNANNGHDADLVINNLRPGYHNISIVRAARSGRGNSRHRGHTIYRENILLRPGMHIDLVINRFGKAFLDENPLMSSGFPGYGYNSFPGSVGIACMDRARFDGMKNTLRKIAFEDTRLSTCKTMMRSEMFSSSQVKELMQLFAFEDNKIEVAKAAYDQTIDPENYFNTYDAFSFNSSHDEMNRFLRVER